MFWRRSSSVGGLGGGRFEFFGTGWTGSAGFLRLFGVDQKHGGGKVRLFPIRLSFPGGPQKILSILSKSPDALGGENCAASSAGRRGLTPGYGEDRWNTSMGTSTRKPMWGRFDSDLGVGLSSLSCGPAGCGPLGRGGTELKVFRVFREWHLSFQQLFSCGSTPTSVLRQSRSPGGVRMPQFEGTTDSRPWRSSPGG